jgi:hypothetical protein
MCLKMNRYIGFQEKRQSFAESWQTHRIYVVIIALAPGQATTFFPVTITHVVCRLFRMTPTIMRSILVYLIHEFSESNLRYS